MTKLRKIDYAGGLLSSAMVIFLLIPISDGGTRLPWSSPTVICLLVFGLLCAGCFALVEYKVSALPMIPRTYNYHKFWGFFSCGSVPQRLTLIHSSSIQIPRRQRRPDPKLPLRLCLLRKLLLSPNVLPERTTVVGTRVRRAPRPHRHRPKHHLGPVGTIHLSQETIRRGPLVRIHPLDTRRGVALFFRPPHIPCGHCVHLIARRGRYRMYFSTE